MTRGNARHPRRRWVHRRGAIFDATLYPPGRLPGSGSSSQGRRALVRFSSTFGVPSPLPDWAGLAIRIFDPTIGDERGHLDVLLVSSAAEPDLWRQMRPSRDMVGCTFTSVARYPLGGADQIVVAVPVEARSATLEELTNGHTACPIRFRLDVAELRGLWRGLGDLEITGRHDEDDPSVRFRPPRQGGSFVDNVRRAVYGWFQRDSSSTPSPRGSLLPDPDSEDQPSVAR